MKIDTCKNNIIQILLPDWVYVYWWLGTLDSRPRERVRKPKKLSVTTSRLKKNSISKTCVRTALYLVLYFCIKIRNKT